ncbi:penicillin-binding protein 2 [bacterium]|nr:MAG: penicillin-binding protein 2 [bacterium]
MVAAQATFEKVFKKRIVFLAVLFIFCMLIIVARLAYMQLFHQGYYKALAESQHVGEHVIIPTRGEIMIQDSFSGQPYTVATSDEKILVYANPKVITDNGPILEKLPAVIGMDRAVLEEKLKDKNKGYVVLKKDLSEAEQEKIKELDLDGIAFDKETSRLYPEGSMLAQLLGFVGYKGDEKMGVYGLELAFNKELSGTQGTLQQEKDNSGRWIFGGRRDGVPAKDGDSLLLTIDKTIQLKVEAVLKDTVEKHGADSGSVVAMDPKTGAIMAMATYPTFDLNNYSKVSSAEVYNNQVTVGAYEPGSIFKPLTMAAALNEGAVTPSMTYVDTGEIKVGSYTIKNSDKKANGVQTMSQVLEQSLNTGTVFLETKIGHKKFSDYINRFGYGKKVGMEVNESAGDLGNLKGNIEINYYTASFGQGISVTPVQLVQSFSAIANGGEMVKPYVVKNIIRNNGKVEEVGKTQSTKILSPKAASEVAAMMVNVVERGHGTKAGVPGYYVAGKTGTAQVPRKDGRGYEENNNIGSFIGFAPVEDPKFVMLVRINHPRSVKFAESTAAPAWGSIASFMLQHYKVAPTR